MKWNPEKLKNHKGTLGKHWKMSEETKIKIGLKNKGRKYSKESRKKISESGKGRIPWNKGKKLSKEYREKLSKAHKGKSSWNKGKHHSEEARKKMSESKLKNPTRYWLGKKRIDMRGENNYRWIKDRTKLKNKQERNDSAYQDWVKQVKKRDDSKCKINNNDCLGYCIAHHILPWRDYPELRYNINNGITLCQAHHPRKRVEEKQFIPIFNELIKTI